MAPDSVLIYVLGLVGWSWLGVEEPRQLSQQAHSLVARSAMA